MTRLLYPSTAEAVTCRRCGNSMPTNSETCPHCGADHGGMIRTENATAVPTGLRAPYAASKASGRGSATVMSPYPSLHEQSDLVGNSEQRWDRSKTWTLGAVVLAFVVGGVVYLEHGASHVVDNHSDADSQVEPDNGVSVTGSIDQAKLARDAAVAAAAATAARMASNNVQPQPTQSQPIAVQPATKPAPVAAAAVPAPSQTSSPAPAYLQQAVVDNLQAARDAIDRGDLTTARRRFSKIPSAAYESTNVKLTQADLVRAEHTRDDKLQAARDCETVGAWTCVRQNARDVLAVDASNVEAQSMVEQAISRSGWLNGSTATAANTANSTAPVSPPAAPPVQSTLGQGVHVNLPPSTTAAAPVTVTGTGTGYAAAANATSRLMPRYGSAPRVRNSSGYSRTPPVVPAFVPPVVSMDPIVARRSPASPSIAPVNVPAQTPAETSATPSARADAPVAVNTPQSAPSRSASFVGTTPEDEERAIRENGWKKGAPATNAAAVAQPQQPIAQQQAQPQAQPQPQQITQPQPEAQADSASQ